MDGKDVITPPKTPKSNRKITIPPFLAEELKEYWDGVRYSPNDAYLPPNIDNFIFVWLANQVLVFYLLLAIGISHLLQRKKTLAKHDNI